MRKLALLLLLLPILCSAQFKTKVYLLGTYHMAGSTDALQVDTGRDDILGSKRQAELKAVLAELEKTGVEKIYVENLPSRQPYWDSIFSAYFKDKPVVLRNEIFQIGIKLAKRLGIRRGVTCIDWYEGTGNTLGDANYKRYSRGMRKISDSLQARSIRETAPHNIAVLSQLEALNAEIPNMHLTDVFLRLNSARYQNTMLYVNSTSYLDRNHDGVGVYQAQEQVVRNMNIYANIMQDILSEKPESVLVLYGAGHIKALTDMFSVHPAIDLVPFERWFKGL